MPLPPEVQATPRNQRRLLAWLVVGDELDVQAKTKRRNKRIAEGKTVRTGQEWAAYLSANPNVLPESPDNMGAGDN